MLDPLLMDMNSAAFEEVYPLWLHQNVQAKSSGLNQVIDSSLHLFVHNSSIVGQSLQFGVKSTIDIAENQIITRFGGLIRNRANVRANINITKTHSIELADGLGLILDGYPLRQSMISATPNSIADLEAMKAMPSSTWGYDSTLLLSNHHKLLKQSGIGFMMNEPAQKKEFNAKYVSVTIPGPGGLLFQTRVVKACKSIPAGTEITCKYNRSQKKS